MRKNIGSAVVKRIITAAMAVMLAFTTPAMTVTAQEAVTEDTTTTDESTNLEDYMTDAEKELVNQLDTDINSIDMTQSAYDIVDDAADTVETDVNAAIESEKANAANAAETAEKVADEAQETLDELKNYEDKTDTLLNNDGSIVAEVEGNKMVETIQADGTIEISVTDADGNKTSTDLSSYTQEKADTAETAAHDAQAIVDSINSNSTAAEITQAAAELQAAVEAAETAKNEAQAAYDSADAVLQEEIKRYNAYIKLYYGEDSDQFISYNGSELSYSDDEYNTFVENEKLALNIGDSVAAVVSDETAETLAAQQKKISDAQQLVENSEEILEQITKEGGSIDQATAAEESMVSMLEGMVAQTENALNYAEGDQKTALEVLHTAATTALKLYTEDIPGQTANNIASDVTEQFNNVIETALDTMLNQINASLEVVEGAQKEALTELKAQTENAIKMYNENKSSWAVTPATTSTEAVDADNNLYEDFADASDTYQTRYKYALASVVELSNKLTTIVKEAAEDVDAKQKAYTVAVDEYNTIKEQLSTATLESTLTALKEKLKLAEANVATAAANLEAAKESYNTVVSIQQNFNAEINNDSDSDNSSSSDSSSSSSSSSTASTTTIADTAAATAATIADEGVPMAESLDDLTTISDDGVALLDEVPTTGDSTATALPFAFGAVAALAGAFVSGLKRKNQ